LLDVFPFSFLSPGLVLGSAAQARLISQLLDSLLPTVHTFELNVARLNDTAMIPKKDYEQNRLVAGMLQLANGTELLIDETRMDEGQLNERGVANLKAIGGLLQTGKLEFDFAYTPGGACVLPFVRIHDASLAPPQPAILSWTLHRKQDCTRNKTGQDRAGPDAIPSRATDVPSQGI
jgi:hypothetical protein